MPLWEISNRAPKSYGPRTTNESKATSVAFTILNDARYYKLEQLCWKMEQKTHEGSMCLRDSLVNWECER